MVSVLLDNALTHGENGSTVDIELRRDGRDAKISVRNTGSVIPSEDLPHVFDRFYRVDPARTCEDCADAPR